MYICGECVIVYSVGEYVVWCVNGFVYLSDVCLCVCLCGCVM